MLAAPFSLHPTPRQMSQGVDFNCFSNSLVKNTGDTSSKTRLSTSTTLNFKLTHSCAYCFFVL